jgi:2-alkenal reductase
MRSSVVAVVAVVAAFLGGTASLLVGKAAGWLDGAGAETVVLSGVDGATPASRTTEEPPVSGAKPLPGNDFDPAQIYRARADGVVTVISLFGDHAETGGGGTAQGSGFVVSEDGYVLTNSHVVTTAGEGEATSKPEAASEVFVEFRDGDRVPARIVGWDLFDDVGLLRVGPNAHLLHPIPLADSSRVQVGQPVAAIGTPFGQTNTITAGIVAATERSIDSLTSQYNLVDAIQTDAPINRGNSGGPLLDARGRAIGINAQIRSESGTAEGVGFAVPINSAVRSMKQLIETGRVRYAWVGISTQTVTPGLARHFRLGATNGASVQSVIEESPAAEAGLRAGGAEKEFGDLRLRPDGDVIVAIDDTPVDSAEDVVRAVTERLPGDRARFTIVRGSKRMVVEVVLAERPTSPPETDR